MERFQNRNAVGCLCEERSDDAIHVISNSEGYFAEFTLNTFVSLSAGSVNVLAMTVHQR